MHLFEGASCDDDAPISLGQNIKDTSAMGIVSSMAVSLLMGLWTSHLCIHERQHLRLEHRLQNRIVVLHGQSISACCAWARDSF